ncbi:MAG: hypothetical protein FJ090_12805 [Deltaproteobacteria bacterium]|nr:hypothetical protein [Deltaproteobacteria bacterium]
MMQLPHEMRDTLVETLDEYLEAQTGNPEPESVAAYVVELLCTVADEMKLDDADEIVLRLESSGELDASLVEMLEEEFESNEDFEYTGEEIVSLVEKVCDVEWTTKDDDEEVDDDDEDDDPDGFFDEMSGEEDEDL